MTDVADLNAVLDRLTSEGALSGAERAMLRDAFRTGQVALASGEGVAAIGGDVTDSIIVVGQGNEVRVTTGVTAEVLRTIFGEMLREYLREYMDRLAGGPRGGARQGDEGGLPPTAAAKPVGQVVATSTGLKYQDIEVGTGAVAERGRKVKLHYTGWLIDGTQFDSSVDRRRPFEFTLGQGEVIRGWEEGLPGMRVGGRRRLVIPPALAYGVVGRPALIPPNAELTYLVELLDVR